MSSDDMVPASTRKLRLLDKKRALEVDIRTLQRGADKAEQDLRLHSEQVLKTRERLHQLEAVFTNMRTGAEAVVLKEFVDVRKLIADNRGILMQYQCMAESTRKEGLLALDTIRDKQRSLAELETELSTYGKVLQLPRRQPQPQDDDIFFGEDDDDRCQ